MSYVAYARQPDGHEPDMSIYKRGDIHRPMSELNSADAFISSSSRDGEVKVVADLYQGGMNIRSPDVRPESARVSTSHSSGAKRERERGERPHREGCKANFNGARRLIYTSNPLLIHPPVRSSQIGSQVH